MSSLCSVFGPRARLLRRLVLIVALLALLALALGGVMGGLGSGALTMLPALALAAMMLARPYLGEHAIAALRRRRTLGARALCSLPSPRRSQLLLARGGRLLAMALAGRAPPLALASCR